MDDVQNANPTILNPSDLPTRRQTNEVKARADGGTGLFDDLIPSNGYESDISRSEASSDEEDSDEIEEIDAQEIYGMPPLRTSLFARTLLPTAPPKRTETQ